MRTIHIATIVDTMSRPADSFCQQTAGNTEAEAIEAARAAWSEYMDEGTNEEDAAQGWQDILDGDGDWILVLTTVQIPA